ncbi:hypothetical protein BDW59DRAFT_155706 [Aspergillus cavernicola]|uniref:Uncharacterized protein n=1 Tax=Aspergillus cavernicola TaxID=176166 RepID=A0ABR4J4C8_9EURO
MADTLPANSSEGFERVQQAASDHFPDHIINWGTKAALAAQAVHSQLVLWSDGSGKEVFDVELLGDAHALKIAKRVAKKSPVVILLGPQAAIARL